MNSSGSISSKTPWKHISWNRLCACFKSGAVSCEGSPFTRHKDTCLIHRIWSLDRTIPQRFCKSNGSVLSTRGIARGRLFAVQLHDVVASRATGIGDRIAVTCAGSLLFSHSQTNRVNILTIARIVAEVRRHSSLSFDCHDPLGYVDYQVVMVFCRRQRTVTDVRFFCDLNDHEAYPPLLTTPESSASESNCCDPISVLV